MKMFTLPRVSTLLFAGTLFLLPQGCGDTSTAPEVEEASPTLEPLVKRAPVGSTIVGVLEESITTCLTGQCSTRTSTKTISRKVGNKPNDLHPVAKYAAAVERPRDTTYTSGDFNFDRRGAKITASREKNGRRQQVIITADSATGHPLSFEFYENGAPEFTDRSSWDSVSGVWYKKTLESTTYKDGKAVVTKKKIFTPTGIVYSALTTSGMELVSGSAAADCNWDEPCLPMPGETWHWFYDTGLLAGNTLDAAWEAIHWGKNWMDTVISTGLNPDAALGAAVDLWYATGADGQGWLNWVGITLQVIQTSGWIVENLPAWLDEAAEWVYTKISNFIHNAIGDPNME